MTAIALAPSPGLDARGRRLQSRRGSRLTVAARRTATAIVAALALTSLWAHRHQLSAAFHILNHLSWCWVTAALVFEGASLASYAVLQRRLLQAGNANISTVDMTRIAVAANAISASVPGGTVWSAPWSWRQLRRYGVDHRLATWVVLVAGALSSFALFVVVVAGAELAGNHGPVASLTWIRATST